MQIFFGQIQDGLARLNDEESRHASRVLRKQVGDQIKVIDGKGSLYSCIITEIGKTEVLAQVGLEQAEFGHVPYELHIGIAPTKNIDRMEWLLEKATEMGVTSIRPFVSAHSERRHMREDRLQRILLSAAKQSMKGKIPHLHPIRSFSEVVHENFDGDRFLAHCKDSVRQEFARVVNPTRPIEILIGPEGDFDFQEIREAVGAGFEPVSLGDSRLRTETAGIVAVATVYNKHALIGD